MADKEQQQGTAFSQASALVKALADLSIMNDENLRGAVTEHITSIYDVRTPKEKIKLRPDGLDYIESSWMDKTWKGYAPLYEYNLLVHNESLGFIDIIVSLTDRITGNKELGAGSARIQTKRDDPDYILDKGNNLKAALTNAIKNAQSKFGVGADVYGKREETKTDEEKARFTSMLTDIRRINSTRARLFEEQWNELGVDFTEFLDQWDIYLRRNITSAEKSSGHAATDDSVVTGVSSNKNQNNIKQNAADTKKQIL